MANFTTSSTNVSLWSQFEITISGPEDGNPFRDVELSANFTNDGKSIVADGFYDGDGIYKIRHMPDREGTWNFRTYSNHTELDGLTGSYNAVTAEPGVHGPVYVRNKFHFAHADGTPYAPFGTTCYAWTHQDETMQRQTLKTLSKGYFNKIRMGVFPKHYIYCENEPLHAMFEYDSFGREDFSRPNPIAFRLLETRIQELGALGIEADIILFHPYDRWGYCEMSLENDLGYLKYLLARISSYRNVWWSLANEYDFLLNVKPMDWWVTLGTFIRDNDPYHHLLSIHNGEPSANFDHTLPWISHVCIQNWDAKQTVAWRQDWGKPVVNDELEYEGNIPRPWGNISGRELVHRFWITVTRGGYAGHGECFLDLDDKLWWAKGGILRGEAASRIQFLRKIIEEDLEAGLTPLSEEGRWEFTRISGSRDGDYRLIYFGEHQPAHWAVGLPMEDGDWDIDLIDTWDMTVTPIPKAELPVSPPLRQRGGEMKGGSPEAAFGVRLPGKPFLALRVKRRRITADLASLAVVSKRPVHEERERIQPLLARLSKRGRKVSVYLDEMLNAIRAMRSVVVVDECYNRFWSLAYRLLVVSPMRAPDAVPDQARHLTDA